MSFLPSNIAKNVVQGNLRHDYFQVTTPMEDEIAEMRANIAKNFCAQSSQRVERFERNGKGRISEYLEE